MATTAIVWRRSVCETGRCGCGYRVADGKEPIWQNVEEKKVGETGHILCRKCKTPVAFTRQFTKEISEHWRGNGLTKEE